MDISPPHFPTFFLRSSDRNKTTVISRSNDAPFSLRFIGVNPRKSAAKVFLKCTKNTELTVARFTRTVTFALLQKHPVVLAASRFENYVQDVGLQYSRFEARQMKLEEWNTYRTRFLVKAKRINSNLTFVDHLGRQHSGRKGDYLVESADGVLSIAPRRIFEDIYVPMSAHQTDAGITTEENNNEQPCDALNFEPLEIEEIKLPNSVSTRQPVAGSLRLRKNVGKGLDKVDIQQPSLSSSGEAPHNRKLPQTFRDRRTTSPRTGLVLM